MAAKRKTPVRKAPAKKKTAMRRKSNTTDAPGYPSKAQEEKWQAEDDVRTLMRADEISKDKARMARARKVAEQQATEAKKVAARLSSSKRTARP